MDIHESARHAFELKNLILARRGDFRLILFADGEFPISLIPIYSFEDIAISKAVNAAVSSRQRVRFGLVTTFSRK